MLSVNKGIPCSGISKEILLVKKLTRNQGMRGLTRKFLVKVVHWTGLTRKFLVNGSTRKLLVKVYLGL